MDAAIVSDMTKAEFLVKHAGAIQDLAQKIKVEAMGTLPCLGLDKKFDTQLQPLIFRAIDEFFAGGEGCTGAVETDDVFTVVLNLYPDESKIGISVSLNLGGMVIKP